MFRRFLWAAFLPAVAALLFVSLYLLHSGVRLWLAAGLAFAFAAAFAAASIAAFPLVRRLSRMSSFANRLRDAQLPAGLNVGDDELGSLSRALNRAADHWRSLLEQLRLESARREDILKSMVEGVLAVDNESRVIFCNDSFARLVGAALPLPERLPLLDLVRDPNLSGMLAEVLSTHQPARQTLQLPASDGRVFEVQAAPMAGASHAGALAILHDITDLERLERVRRDFVANVSHELRTPLTAIRGYAESLLDGGLEDPERSRKFLEIILNHSVRLNNVAADLLTLSELESGRQPAPERISIQAAVDDALRAVESEAKTREVNLTRGQIHEAEVLGNRMRLEQALINLLTNAVKFNRPGGDARVDAAVVAAGAVAITVSDTGIGIPSEHLPRIFERFYRVDSARSRELGGTGLGLSIVKHVVDRMGGSVSVKSQVGKGAVFTVKIPVAPKAP